MKSGRGSAPQGARFDELRLWKGQIESEVVSPTTYVAPIMMSPGAYVTGDRHLAEQLGEGCDGRRRLPIELDNHETKGEVVREQS